jgi:hypothetical protein
MNMMTSPARVGLDAVGPLDRLTQRLAKLVAKALEAISTNRPLVAHLGKRDETLGGS